MKILVTGATGFVGSFLCKLLRNQGHQVVTASRSSGKNILELEKWKSDLQECDTVIHLAARVHQMKDDSTDPLTTYRQVNTQATIQLAKACAHYGVKKFIFLSSIKVNGEGRDLPYSENDTPTPSDPYGISKHEAEIELKELSNHGSMEICCIRSPLVYGKGVKANFKTLINISKARTPLPIKSIHNKRSFIYVENLCDFILHSLKIEKNKFEVYLLADGAPISTYQLVKALSDVQGIKNRCFSFPEIILKLSLILIGKGAIYQKIAGNLSIDPSKALNVWAPPYSMNDGLRRTLNNA